MIFDEPDPAEWNPKPNRWGPLLTITAGMAVSCKRSWTKRLTEPTVRDSGAIWCWRTIYGSWQMRSIHLRLPPAADLSPNPPQMDVSQRLSWGQIWWRTLIFLPPSLPSEPGWVIDGEGYFCCFSDVFFMYLKCHHSYICVRMIAARTATSQLFHSLRRAMISGKWNGFEQL